MNRVAFLLLIPFFLILTIQCTSTRWTVIDMESIDYREEPENRGSSFILQRGDSPTVTNPLLHLQLYRVDQLEYSQRVLVERTVQKYEPKWGFTLLGSIGAALTFYAANTDDFIDRPSVKQTMALNTTGVMLTAMAFTNMRTRGEPIRTGETRQLRKSGTVEISDTTAVSAGELDIEVEIRYDNRPVFERQFRHLDNYGLEINLSGLMREERVVGIDPGSLDVRISSEDASDQFSIPLDSILIPTIVVESPIAELRDRPVWDDTPPFAEVGSGSELILISQAGDNWFEVQFGGSALFISDEAGEVHWRAGENISDPTIVAIEEVPFGDVSVEYSVPRLKQANPHDRGYIFSNHRNNQAGVRRHLGRDYRLMELYFRDAFSIADEHIYHHDLQGSVPELNSAESDSSSLIYAYIGGFARLSGEPGSRNIEMVYLDDERGESVVELEDLLVELASRESAGVVAFIDLDFQFDGGPGVLLRRLGNGDSVYSRLADKVRTLNENSALVYSSRPDQSSGLYESVRFERNYHHIFPYYLAQGLQQRRTVLSDLIDYMNSQVDYTSRRLHDRPQTVQAFGNLSINLSE